jgi:DNA polymerase-3 subunit beta
MLNIKVNRNKFLKALHIVEKAVRDNKIRPVLSGVYLEAKEDKITFKGTDLELNIQSYMFGKIIEEGEIVFSFQLVDEYLKEIDDEEIQLIETDGTLLIETENSSSEFSIYDADEYPKINIDTEGRVYEISKSLIVDMLEKVKISSAVTNENPAVNAVRIELEHGKIKMAATDTYRLTYIEEGLEDAMSGSTKISLPLHSAEALIKILKSVGDEFVKFRFVGNQAVFEIEKVILTSRVVDLAFPDYKGIFENTVYNKQVVVDTETLISVLKRVQVFVKNNTESKNSALFDLVGNRFFITGVSDSAKVKEELELEKEGEDLKLSLNVKFMLDYLVNLDKDKNSIMKMSNSSGAVLMKNEENSKYLYILMPLALREE